MQEEIIEVQNKYQTIFLFTLIFYGTSEKKEKQNTLFGGIHEGG